MTWRRQNYKKNGRRESPCQNTTVQVDCDMSQLSVVGCCISKFSALANIAYIIRHVLKIVNYHY